MADIFGADCVRQPCYIKPMINDSIVLESLEVDASLNYLWMMYVDRVNIDHHCLRCLRGKRSALVDNTRRSYKKLILNESQIPTVYLCALQSGGPLDRNVHLALRLSPGRRLVVNETNIKARVRNAERILIAPWPGGSGKGDGFDRCRNWQFAKSFVAHDGLPPTLGRR